MDSTAWFMDKVKVLRLTSLLMSEVSSCRPSCAPPRKVHMSQTSNHVCLQLTVWVVWGSTYLNRQCGVQLTSTGSVGFQSDQRVVWGFTHINAQWGVSLTSTRSVGFTHINSSIDCHIALTHGSIADSRTWHCPCSAAPVTKCQSDSLLRPNGKIAH
jgi:hypothetical protein